MGDDVVSVNLDSRLQQCIVQGCGGGFNGLGLALEGEGNRLNGCCRGKALRGNGVVGSGGNRTGSEGHRGGGDKHRDDGGGSATQQ